MKIRINMLSKADSVPGQGVGSAYLEQVNLVKQCDKFEVEINSPKSNFDIYHIHSVNFRYFLRMNKKHANIVYVHFIPKENEGSISLWKPIQKIFDWYVVKLYKKADELIVVNPYFISPLMELGIDKSHITYIPNYVSSENFYPLGKGKAIAIRQKYDIPLDKFVVLGCGQIQTRKGFDDFVEVAKNNPDILFVWAGGFSFGRITHGYKKYKKILANPPANLKVLGIISRDKMNDIYNMSDMFFMPSFKELFPMTILEVANVNKPILLRDLSLYEPILFDNYLKGKNVEDFSNLILKLKDDKEFYEEWSLKSDVISKIYCREANLKLWDDYYSYIFSKYKH